MLKKSSSNSRNNSNELHCYDYEKYYMAVYRTEFKKENSIKANNFLGAGEQHRSGYKYQHGEKVRVKN